MLFIIVHLVICSFCYVVIKKKGKNNSFPIVIVWCIPVFGIVLWAADYLMAVKKKIGRKTVHMDKLKVTDARFRKVVTDTREDREVVVPLEEALIVNDTKLRRNLMLDILHKNPEEYLHMLQKASTSSDVEVTHYATTALLEIQNDYERRIQDYMKRCRKSPENLELLKEYKECLDSYVNSGLISGTVLKMQRKNLSELLEKLVALKKPLKEDIYKYIENAIELKDYKEAERILFQYRQECERDEEWYQLAIRYYWELGRGEEIKELLKQMKEEKVYLSSEGKKWYAFWNKE